MYLFHAVLNHLFAEALVILFAGLPSSILMVLSFYLISDNFFQLYDFQAEFVLGLPLSLQD